MSAFYLEYQWQKVSLVLSEWFVCVYKTKFSVGTERQLVGYNKTPSMVLVSLVLHIVTPQLSFCHLLSVYVYAVERL